MSFFRQYIAPLAVVIIFLIALFAVSIRIFLPSDMAAPAPVSMNNLERDAYSYAWQSKRLMCSQPVADKPFV